MTRLEKIRKHIDKNGIGIEIGPIHTPKAPKREGYNVHVIDHLSREELLEKYKHHPINLSNIEEVDFIWNGEKYSDLTGVKKHYDWIIASHVIEHTPDLIGFLNNCDEILKESGVISLVVPDKRYCFDHFRPITGLARVIDSHIGKHTIHTPGTVAEYFLNVSSMNGENSWRPHINGDYQLKHSIDDARRHVKLAQNGEYVDGHAWCFTPHSFRLMIQDLFALGFIQVQEIDFQLSKGSEFYLTLGRSGAGCTMNRMELLTAVDAETKSTTSSFTRMGINIRDTAVRVKRRIGKRPKKN